MKKSKEIMNKSKRTEQEQQALLECIREKYVYDASTGRVRNKARDRPREGAINKKWGYRRLCFHINRKSFAVDEHICAWIMTYGRWPVGTIDHLDNDPLNNRIENLRECSQGENHLNMLHPWVPNETTGVPGVFPSSRKYRCRIRGKRFSFSNPYEAFFFATLCGKRYKAN